MAVLAVVYWSGSASITLAARAVAGGAAAAGAEVHMVDVLHPKDIDWSLLARADGIVLGAPTLVTGGLVSHAQSLSLLVHALNG